MQEAESLAQEAHKTAGEGWRGPSIDKELARSVEFHQSSIADAIEKANTDNARIYFQRVPSTVPQVQPAVMVTSATPQGGLGSCGLPGGPADVVSELLCWCFCCQ